MFLFHHKTVKKETQILFWGGLIVFGLVFCVFHSVLSFSFVNWDDPFLLTQEPKFLHLSWRNFFALFSPQFFIEGTSVEYAPLRDLSYWVDRWVWGWDPGGFHLTNLILHGVNSFLVFWLFLKYFPWVLSFLGALLWALHPIQAEAVGWVSGRKDLLAGFFIFGSLVCLHSQRWKETLIWGIGAFLSKVTSMSLGCAWVLPWKNSWMGKNKRIWAVGGILLGVLFSLFIIGVNRGRDSVFVAHSWMDYLKPWPAAFQIFSQSIFRILFPLELSARYVQKLEWGFFNVWVFSGFFIFWGLVFGSFFLLKKKSFLGVGLAWTLIFWIPSLPIVPTNIWMADRYLYVPFWGMIFFLLGLVSISKQTRIGKILILILGIFCLGGAYLSSQRVGVWKNSLSLWTDCSQKSSELYYVWTNLGLAQKEEGKMELAQESFQRALFLNPGWSKGKAELAKIEFHLGHVQKARDLLLEIETHQDLSKQEEAWVVRAEAWISLGELKKAEVLFVTYLQRKPRSPIVWSNLGTVYAQMNQPEKAIEAWERAISIYPKSPTARINRARFWFLQKNCERVKEDLEAGEFVLPKDRRDRDWLLEHCK